MALAPHHCALHIQGYLIDGWRPHLLGINIVPKVSFSGMFFTEARVMSSTLMHEVQNNIKDALLFIAPF